jgi:RNA polymerase sigma factor (sigma-70 family)
LLWRTACNLATTRNEHRQHQQRARPLLEVELEDDQTPESALADKQLKAAAKRAIAELPERQRQVLTLRAEGHTYEQIAQQLSINERTCRRDHKLAIVEIRQKIGLEQRT